MVGGMDNDARDAARSYYADSSRCLQADMAALAETPGGVVVFTPRLVALLRPVRADSPAIWEQLHASIADADAWYVHLLVGDLALARQLAHTLPPLPQLCFRRGLRDRRPHVLPWHRILL